MDYPIIRSALFVPGNRPDRIDNAVKSNADAVVIDLEDSVPASDKDTARNTAVEKIKKYPKRLIITRINSIDSEWVINDLEVIVCEPLKALVFPKADKAVDLTWLDSKLCFYEEKMGIQKGQVKVFPLIETARGVRDMAKILCPCLSQERLWTAFFGAADYTADMGIDMTPGAEELAYARSYMAIACRAAELAPPIDTPFMLDIKNTQMCEDDARRAKQYGFQGKQCIHPVQVDVVNTVFSPNQKQIDEATQIIDAYHKALKANSAAVQLNGKFIDPPIVERAQKTLDLVAKINSE